MVSTQTAFPVAGSQACRGMLLPATPNLNPLYLPRDHATCWCGCITRKATTKRMGEESFMNHSCMRLQTFNRHEKRPDDLRIEQLKEPWEDPVTAHSRAKCDAGLGGVEFDTSCAMKPPGLFNQDGRSIFIPGVCDHHGTAIVGSHTLCDSVCSQNTLLSHTFHLYEKSNCHTRSCTERALVQLMERTAWWSRI
jgi:hypothetical protein